MYAEGRKLENREKSSDPRHIGWRCNGATCFSRYANFS